MDGEILIGFGRLPALARRQRSERHPETFAFLGFTHYCGWTRDGRFIVKLKTQSKRLTRKLKALRHEAWQLMHASLANQHRCAATTPTSACRTTAVLERVPAGSPAHLVQRSQAAEPNESADGPGLVR
jgi:hypothetical protein